MSVVSDCQDDKVLLCQELLIGCPLVPVLVTMQPLLLQEDDFTEFFTEKQIENFIEKMRCDLLDAPELDWFSNRAN